MNKSIKFSKKDENVKHCRAKYYIDMGNAPLNVKVGDLWIVHLWIGFYTVWFTMTVNGKLFVTDKRGIKGFKTLSETESYVRSEEFLTDLETFHNNVVEKLKNKSENFH